MDFKSEQVAEQMTLLDAELFHKIDIPEVLLWSKEQSEEYSPNLAKFTEHFNKMSYWWVAITTVTSELVYIELCHLDELHFVIEECRHLANGCTAKCSCIG